MEFITAKTDTYLKKDWEKQASQLDDSEKLFVPKGKTYGYESFMEFSPQRPCGGHSRITLAYGSGTWYTFDQHWEYPWDTPLVVKPVKNPEWNEVDWTDFSMPVSQYFTVGEVTLRQKQRIPTDVDIKKNVIRMARAMDEIREWYGVPLHVTSWFRPWNVERRVGGSGANHPYGYAVDCYPTDGSVANFERRFLREWYNKGKWNHGFGLGAKNGGYCHFDLRHKRKWYYC